MPWITPVISSCHWKFLFTLGFLSRKFNQRRLGEAHRLRLVSPFACLRDDWSLAQGIHSAHGGVEPRVLGEVDAFFIIKHHFVPAPSSLKKTPHHFVGGGKPLVTGERYFFLGVRWPFFYFLVVWSGSGRCRFFVFSVKCFKLFVFLGVMVDFRSVFLP